ncbi:hypothetical protein [Paenibacillus larvae]|uniref:hypothetical protein n=1 Tax=Paenibacillus larvae TaxID=1464 RepID=UPI00289039A0|nr:hypothetical protein [Paenibacillus larvae]MDT2193389.1 hypothetical protein [Paenibacillus larvae]
MAKTRETRGTHTQVHRADRRYGANQNRLTESELAELDEYLEQAVTERIHRGGVIYSILRGEYFSETRNPGNPGNWDSFELEDVADAPQFHKEICDEMNRISYVRGTAR